jgi:hypothetical protein
MFIHVPTTLTLSLFIHVPTTQYHQGPCLSFQSSSSFIHVPPFSFLELFFFYPIFLPPFSSSVLVIFYQPFWMDGWKDGWMVEGYEQENTFSLGPVQLLTTVGLA